MTPAELLSVHAWNPFTGGCACGAWSGNRPDHGAHQIAELERVGFAITPARI